MRGFIRFFFTLLFLGAMGAVAFGWLYLQNELPKPGPLEADKLVYIAPGSVRDIGNTLIKNNVITDEWLFRFGVWKRKPQGPLKSGEYMFKAHGSTEDAIAVLQSGKEYQRKLTIPEGLTSYEIVTLVNGAEAMDGTLDIARLPAEGTLLPETYNYTYGVKRTAIIDRMAEAMKKTLAEYWPKKSANSLVKSEAELVTLASIVERETGIATERPRVAGVFMNRMKLGMPLQSDPTAIYVLSEGKGKLGRPLTSADLRVDSPYNTYVAQGLPPGPIANPGKESLLAVAQPETHDYLYFVADGTGGHAFGRNLDEHNRNVANWRAHQQQK
ncbi:MAG TPA: endolytic transglycosylase MltG [Patescibacteria group bacterium]|nr:endolytic transglycosylase MltG [Patescibacteria group bacterium]